MPQNQPNASYVVYEVQRVRVRDSGWRALPVAGPDLQASQLVKLFAAFEMEYVNFLIASDGALPVVPSPTDLVQDQNYVFREFIFGGTIGIPQVDGRVRYQTSGTYVYHLLVPQGLDDYGFNLGVPPWLPGQAGAETIPPQNFMRGLLNTVPVSQGIGVNNQQQAGRRR